MDAVPLSPLFRPVSFADLPGWQDDDHLAALKAFRRSAYQVLIKPYRTGSLGIAFASFDAHNSRNLKQAAGNAVAYGMPYEAALRAVTIDAARVWGVDDRYGTIEVGKEADVVVWSGDPLELTTSVEHVIIRGREVSTDNRQKRLFERYRRLDGAMPSAYRH